VAHISKCLHEYGIQGKVSCSRASEVCQHTHYNQILVFTADNTSNNNTLVDELGELLDGFQGSLTRVHSCHKGENCHNCHMQYVHLLTRLHRLFCLSSARKPR
jgi:hypothetical protein